MSRFWLSGLIAVSIYLLLIYLLFLAFREPPRIEQPPQEVMKVDLTLLEPSINGATEPVRNESQSEPQPPLSQQVSKSHSPQLSQQRTPPDSGGIAPSRAEPDLGELFSHLAPVKSEPSKPLKNYAEAISASVKSPLERSQSEPKKSLSAIADLTLLPLDRSHHSDGSGDQEYFYRIADMIEKGYQPQPDEIGLVVGVELKIAADGSFTYKIVRSSGRQSCDERVTRLLEKMKEKGLPPPEKSLSVRLNFKAKGRS
ncbi:MAG: TonB C-terminal domain-containing protein [Campylobacterales bacterium]